MSSGRTRNCRKLGSEGANSARILLSVTRMGGWSVMYRDQMSTDPAGDRFEFKGEDSSMKKTMTLNMDASNWSNCR